MTEAIIDLRKRGFSVDFNLEENCLVCNEEKFHTQDFEITEMYRFEGDTDPADQSVLYAIESKNGLKGILVNAFGLYADAMSNEIIQKLSFHKN